MGGDYIPFDHDFPEKPEVLALSQCTGVTIAEIMLRCHKIWRQFDRHTPDGFLENIGPRGVALLCGGEESFWLAVEEVGWIIFRDDGCEMVGFKERLDGGKGCAYKRMRKPEVIKEANRRRQARKRARDKARDNGRDTHRDAERDTPVTPPVTFAPQNQNQNQYQNQDQNQESEPSSASNPSTWSSSSRSPGARADEDPTARTTTEATETTDRDDDDQINAGGDGASGQIDWNAAIERANRVCQRLGVACPRPADRSLVLKVCGLVEAGRVPEGWLSDAVAGVKESASRKARPWAYFHSCLANTAAENGLTLNTMLASVTPPGDQLKARAAR